MTDWNKYPSLSHKNKPQNILYDDINTHYMNHVFFHIVIVSCTLVSEIIFFFSDSRFNSVLMEQNREISLIRYVVIESSKLD